jgi:hypothetical protein
MSLLQVCRRRPHRPSANSIYRNRTIRVVFTPEVRSDYREDESMEPMDLIFDKEEQIADA